MKFTIDNNIFNLDELRIESETLTEKECRMKENEAIILKYLIKHLGKKISSKDLQNIVRLKKNQYPSDSTIQNLVSDLRNGHGGALHDYVKTPQEGGYKFVMTDKLEILEEDAEVSFIDVNIEPVSRNNYVPRQYLSGRIKELHTQNRIVAICGMSGSGKSEVAREYVKQAKNNGEYKNAARFELSEEGDDRYDQVLSKSGLFDYDDDKLSVSGKDRLRKKLMTSLSSDTLLLIENVNCRENISLLNDICSYTGSAKVILTSQLSSAFLGDELGFACLDINEEKDDEFFLSLFRKYSGDISASDDDIMDIIEMTGRNCLAATAVAAQVRNNVSVEETKRELEESIKEGLSLCGNLGVQKDTQYRRGTPYEILKAYFFKVVYSRYTEIQRQVLGAWILSPKCYRTVGMLPAIVGDNNDHGLHLTKAKEAMSQLIDMNVLFTEPQTFRFDNTETVSMHPIYQELFSEGRYQIESAAEMSPAFIDHILKNELCLSEAFIFSCKSKEAFDWLKRGAWIFKKLIYDDDERFWSIEQYRNWKEFYARDYLTEEGILLYSKNKIKNNYRYLKINSDERKYENVKIVNEKLPIYEMLIRSYDEFNARHPENVEFMRLDPGYRACDCTEMYFKKGEYGFSIYKKYKKTGEESCVIDCSSIFTEESRYYKKGWKPAILPVEEIPDDEHF